MENIEEFMKKVEIINKYFARYYDKEKGIAFSVNTVNLLPRIDYLELDKTTYETQKFEGKMIINAYSYGIFVKRK